MSTANVSLVTARDMLLDYENGDADRVAQQLGSRPPKTQPTDNPGAGLVGDGDRRKKKKKKKRKPVEKSEKYHSEGPCSGHGSRCGHASSECYILHPELKPKPKGEAAVAAVRPEEDDETPLEPGAFGFMNEEWLNLKNAAQENDELWYYSSSKESWQRLAGRAGYVLVRGDIVVASIQTTMN